jgi:4-alpha-glucanotransferase
MKTQEYTIQASYLIPAYNLPNGVQSDFITTQYGYSGKNSIKIDVWLVRAERGQEQKTMFASLQYEADSAQKQLAQSVQEDAVNPVDSPDKKSVKTRRLENALQVFNSLIETGKQPVFHKKPDVAFVDIARRNMAMPTFQQFSPNVEKAVYLSALSRYEER